MVTTTTTYSLKKPTVGDDEDLWGGYLNDSMDLIDDVLDGTTPVTGIDINSGTIDNAVIGGTTPVAGTFTTLTANTSLGVTGNITVSGTVDGRDVAADGTKLDGIESGATADQTKADIDALGIAASTAATLATARNIALTGAVTGNVNFDGSGNVSIATTATSDPTITLTGAVTGSGTMTNLGNVSIATTATADPTLTLSGDASGSATFTNLGNATLSVTIADDSHNHVIANVDGLQTALDGKQAAGTYNTIIGTDSDINTSGSTIIDNIYVTDGVITSMGTRTLTTGDIGAYSSSGGTISGNVTINGTLSLGSYTINDVEDIYLRDKLFHDGDTDTYLGFGTNTINLVTGNSTSATFNSSGIFVTDGSVAEDYDALSGTTPTCNVDNGGAFSLSMSGNTTFTFSGASSGYSQGFVLQLTGNGSTVTWPSSVDWAGGTAPDAPASGETDIYVFWTRDGGTTWYGVQSIDAAA